MILGTKSNQLPILPGSIPDEQLILVPDPVTGELKRSTFGQAKADIILAIGDLSYLDDIIEVPTIADLPQPGQIKKIYVITTGPDANKQFRWGGSIYIEFPQGSGDVAAEAVIRGNADTTLQANIDAETAARIAADSNLQTNINSEATARQNADTTLQNNLSAEANTRATNDAILQGQINTESTIRANADAALNNRINNIEAGTTPIDDVTPALNKVYSSQKTQNLVDVIETDIAAIKQSHFLGVFLTLAALTAAHPSPVAGDYADIDAGTGTDTQRYIYDVNDDNWVASGSGTPLTAAQIKTLYESNANTNAYTDAEKSKLAGIVSGIWSGTGSIFTSYAKGDLIYASATNVLTKLAIDSDETKVLGISAGVPVWRTISGELPSMLGNSGKWLTTNGTIALWATNTGWSTSGNAGTSSSTNFIGTTDNTDIVFKRNNSEQFRLTSNGLRYFGYLTVKVPDAAGSPGDILRIKRDLGDIDVLALSMEGFNKLKFGTAQGVAFSCTTSGISVGTNPTFVSDNDGGSYYGTITKNIHLLQPSGEPMLGFWNNYSIHVCRAAIYAGYEGSRRGYMRFVTASGASADPSTSLKEVLRLTSYQEMLVGTTSRIPSAKVVIESSSQGILIPRMSAAQAETIASPAEGLLLYVNDVTTPGSTITTKGWWGYDGSGWIKLN